MVLYLMDGIVRLALSCFLQCIFLSIVVTFQNYLGANITVTCKKVILKPPVNSNANQDTYGN